MSSFRVNLKTYAGFSLTDLLALALLRNPVNSILENFFLHNSSLFIGKYSLLYFYACVIILMVPISIVHELIHGAVYTIGGGKVKFGYKGIYFYTQEVSMKPIKRTVFLLVLLSPLVVISIISAAFGGWLWGMVFLINFLGSSGDLFMALFLIRQRHDSRIIDRPYGFDVI